MSKLITDLKTLHNETLKNLKSSKSVNTVRAYKSDFSDFKLFCVKNGFKDIPTEPKIVSIYLTYLSSKDIKLCNPCFLDVKAIIKKPIKINKPEK